MRIQIGVLSSTKENSQEEKEKARQVGLLIPKNGAMAIVNTDYPNALSRHVVSGVYENGGNIFGISSENNVSEAEKEGFPINLLTTLCATGLNKLKGNVFLLQSSQGAVLLDEEVLSEFLVAYRQTRHVKFVVGILSKNEIDMKERLAKETDLQVIVQDDPEILVVQVVYAWLYLQKKKK